MSINWWIAAILLFDFKLQHIPGSKHARPDGLSHCQHFPEDDEPNEMPQEIDNWLDDIVSCGIWIADTVQQEGHYLVLKVVKEREEVIDDNICMWRLILDWFWWPSVEEDVNWFIKTCHQCQICSIKKVVIPPTISILAPLFWKAHVNTMHMPLVQGYCYIIQACCLLIDWPEWRKLKKENGRTIGMFIFEEVLCWWKGCEEVVTDNVLAMVAALDWLSKTYHINYIQISAYNSRANGIVERSHRTMHDSIVKACNGDITQWPEVTPHTFWVDWVTTRKAMGHSPFCNAHSTKPLLPFDIMEATFMLPPVTAKLSTSDLLGLWACQLAKREEDLAKIQDNVVRACFASIAQFEKQFKSTIHNYNFQTGDSVLVLNKALAPESNTKCKPRYFRPMLVIRCTARGS